MTRAVLVLLLLAVTALAGDEHVTLQPPFAPNGGAAWLAELPARWRGDDLQGEHSRVLLLEDGAPLGPAHAPHVEIRAQGGGRYSHWGGRLFFSASDGSDPNTNGRTYTARLEALPPGREGYVSVPPRDPFVLLDGRALAQTVAGGLPDGVQLGRRPRLVYWYTIDALRADTAFAEHDGAPLMPALADFAAQAVRFDTAYAPSSFTKISTASMFTGLSPARHRVMHGVAPVWPEGGELVFDLDPRFYTLAEFLRDAGYHTLTHPYTIHVRPGDGMLQGFARTDLASASPAPLEALPERLFAYEHVLGVHGPYAPSAEARAALGLEPARSVDPAGTSWFSGALSEQQLAELRAHYRAEAVDADARLAERLAWIRAQGLWDDAVIVVTADHGEAFGEHGATQHTSTLYEETVRVPLLVRFPAWHPWAERHGERVLNRVSLVDVYATLVDLMVEQGDPLPYALDGASLGPILDGSERDPLARDVFLRTTFTTRVPGASERALLTADAVLAGRLKALLGWRLTSSQHAASAEFCAGEWTAELYDVTRDAAERTNLILLRRDDFERLAERVRAQFRPLAAAGMSAHAVEGVEPEAPDPELLARLEALGYL